MPSNPFKTWLEPSPLRLLPNADDPKLIRVDAAHTWAINGVGKDLYASSLILLSRMGLFGKNGSIERRLQAAFEKFQDFLNRTGKSSTIDIFNFMTLKCSKSLLVCITKTSGEVEPRTSTHPEPKWPTQVQQLPLRTGERTRLCCCGRMACRGACWSGPSLAGHLNGVLFWLVLEGFMG